MANNRVYFPNLSSSRFVAAIAVIVHHIELVKHWFGQPNIYTNSFVGGVFGQIGIIFFFVLSGFLITYLLLEEHRQTGTISIKHFYMRRILKIWPLYYLIVILGLFILPKIAFLHVPGYTELVGEAMVPKTAMFFTFFSNLAYTLYRHVPYAEQAWSVGVEEQFYLLWPLLILLVIKRNKVIHMLWGVIIFYVLVKIVTIYLHNTYPDNLRYQQLWLLWNHFTIDCMALGGIAAYVLFYKKERILKIVFNRYVQWTMYVALAVITVKGIAVPEFNYEFYALIFFVIVLNLAANKKTVINLEYKPLNYLGKISYGIYMYHNLMIVIALQLVLMIHPDILSTVTGNILLYVGAFGLTILTASLSYTYFERRFIHAKVKYSKVVSGDNAVEEEEEERAVKTEQKVHLPALPQTA
ncbi:MAG: acyltransferase [Chitinophagales bacterium]|nr:acyltransferase [Chitinophagaceae bacterium]MCB9064239.1 acyltransferase [Chitinophagales bacterium]